MVLERNGTNKNDIEFDVDKDSWIISWISMLKKPYTFKSEKDNQLLLSCYFEKIY